MPSVYDKPKLWTPFERGLLTPDNEWQWENILIAMPFWDIGSLAAKDFRYGGRFGTNGTLDGNAEWRGDSVNLDGSASAGTGIDFGTGSIFAIGTGEWSHEVVIRFDSLTIDGGTDGQIIAQDASNQRAWTIYFQSNGSVHFGFFSALTGNLRTRVTAAGTIVAGRTYHFVFRRSGNSLEVTRNGIQIATVSGNNPTGSEGVNDSSSNFYIGRRDFTSFNGAINATVYLYNYYNRALDNGECFAKAQDPFAMYRMTERVVIRVPASGGQALTEVQADTEEIAEAVTSLRAMNRFVSDTLEMAEQTVRSLELVRLISETEEISEQALAILGLTRENADTEEIAEAVAVVLGITREAADQLDIAEATAAILGRVRQGVDTAEISEAINVALGRVRNAQDTLELAESILAPRTMTRTVNETLEIAEGIVRARTMIRPVSEVVEIAEEVVKRAALIRSIADTIEISEGTVRLLPESVTAIIDLDMPIRSLDLAMSTRSLDLTMPIVP